MSTGSKKFWKTAKFLRNVSGHIGVLTADETTSSTVGQKVEALAYHFVQANNLTHNDVSSLAQQVNLFAGAFEMATSTSGGESLFTSVNEIEETIKKSRPHKSPGENGISNIMIKHLPLSAFVLLMTVFNHCIVIRHWPQSFKNAKVNVIPKTVKNPRVVNSYRNISLLCALGKVLEKILHDHVLNFIYAYCKNCFFQVHIGNVKFGSRSIIAGLAQGSIFLPLRFRLAFPQERNVSPVRLRHRYSRGSKSREYSGPQASKRNVGDREVHAQLGNQDERT